MSSILIKYIIFCTGCALLQNAYTKTPTAKEMVEIGDILGVPFAFLRPDVRSIVSTVAIVSFIVEIATGLILVSWWAGLFFWIPALLLVNFLLLPVKNPAILLILGILITIISGWLLLI